MVQEGGKRKKRDPDGQMGKGSSSTQFSMTHPHLSNLHSTDTDADIARALHM